MPCFASTTHQSGLHTVIGIALAFVLNLNRVAVLLGVYANLPWIIAGYYAFTTMLGAEILGVHLPPGFQERLRELFELSLLHQAFWIELGRLLRPLLWPYVIGSMIGSAVLAAIAYPVALAFVVRQRRHVAILKSRNKSAT